MKRKIKFRAWDGTTMIYDFSQDKNMLQILVGISDEDDCLEAFWEGEPNKMTLMQFTGLLDKNGKEIYEGDILSLPEDRFPYEVFFGDYGWNVRLHFSEGRKSIAPLVNDLLSHYEIIGNIHQNPELLNENKK